jgi:ribonuclease VapC
LILDSSAVVAVILGEDGHLRILERIEAAAEVVIGAPTLFETELVITKRLHSRARALVLRFLEENEVIVTPFDGRHWELAAEAFIRFGKGRHPARLNYGDCMTYATARFAAEPLLFVGEDFGKTDLTPALA